MAVAFEWQQVRVYLMHLFVISLSHHTMQWPFSSVDGNKSFSVRWDGFYEAKHSGPITIFVSSVGGVRIYLESFQVFDHWAFESVNTSARHCCVSSGQMYSLRVEYTKNSRNVWPASIRLDILTSEGSKEDGPFLTQSIHITGSPFALSVMPAAACASKFAVSNPSLGTTGVPVKINLISRDMFGNPTLTSTLSEIVPWEFIRQGDLAEMNATVSYPGSWNVFWIPRHVSNRPYFTLVSRSELLAGVAATFYSDYDMLNPRMTSILKEPSMTSSVFSTMGLPWPCVRFAGILMLDVSRSAILQIERSSLGQGFRLYFDGQLKIEIPMNAYANDKIELKIISGRLHRVELHYWQSLTGTSLPWSMLYADGTVSRSMQLFNIPSFFPLTTSIMVFPARISPENSLMNGPGLTVATAGIAAFFTITALDEYNNQVTSANHDILVFITDSTKSSKINGFVKWINGTYQATYTAIRAPSSILSVSTTISLPRLFVISVAPGASCASKSAVMPSSSISLATAGIVSSFVVISRDEFDNSANFAGAAVAASVKRIDGFEQHSLLFNAASDESQAIFYYRTTSTGIFAVDIRIAQVTGLSTTFCSADSTTQQCSASHVTPFLDFSYNESFKYSFSGRFIVKSQAYLKAPFTGMYIFQVLVSHAVSCLMTLEGDPIINATFANEASISQSGNVFLNSGAMVEMKMQVVQRSPNGFTKLQWNVGQGFVAVPATNFYTKESSLALFNIRVEPASTCGTQSYARGTAISLASLNSLSTFEIVAVDHLGNSRSACDDIFVVRMRPTNRVQDIFGSVTFCASGIYSAAYIADELRNEYLLAYNNRLDPLLDSSSLWLDLLVSQAVPGALGASYYSFDSPFSVFVPNAPLTAGENIPSSVSSIFAVKYAGFVRPTVSGTCTFQVQMPESAIIQGGSFSVGGKLPILDELEIQDQVVLVEKNKLYDITFIIRSLHRFRQVDFTLLTTCNGKAAVVLASDLFSEHIVQSRTFYGTGLFATYYGSDLNQPISAVPSPTIDWAETSSQKSPSKNQPNASAVYTRWSGVIKPPAQSLFTFFVLKNSGPTRAALIIDGNTLIDDASSATTVSATFFMGAFPSYTIQLSYDLPVSRSGAFIQLQWACDPLYLKLSSAVGVGSCNSTRQVISASSFAISMTNPVVIANDTGNFLWNVSGHSQSTLLSVIPKARGRGISFNAPLRIKVIQAEFPYTKQFKVFPASNLSAVSYGLAGTPSIFSIIIYDDTNSAVTVTRCFVLYRLKYEGINPFRYSQQAAEPMMYEDTNAFKLSRIETASGTYVAQIFVCDKLIPGLASTWFSLPNWTGTQIQNTTSRFNFVWYYANQNGKVFGAQFSVRWTGFLVPDVTENGIIDVFVSGDFWIIVNYTLMLNVTCSSNASNFRFPLKRVRGVVQNIEIAFSSCSTVPAYLNLMYSSPSHANSTISPKLLSPSCILANQSTVFIEPQRPCATTSRVVLDPVLGQTVTEVPIKFNIQMKDEYGNNVSSQSLIRTSCIEMSNCFLNVAFRNQMSQQTFQTARVNLNDTSGINNNELSFTATIVAPGLVEVEATLFAGSGVFATYYSSDNLAVPSFTEFSVPPFVLQPDSLMNRTTASLVGNSLLSVLSGSNSFSIRWMGQYIPKFSGLHTFVVLTEGSTTLALDAVEMISVKNPSAAVNRSFVAHLVDNRYYDIFVEYTGSKSPSVPLSLQFVGPDATSKSLTGSEIGYHYVIGGGLTKFVYDFKRALVPAMESAQFTRVMGSGLTIATVGIVSFVSILVQDRFGLSADGLVVVRAIAMNTQAVSVEVDRGTMSCDSCPTYISSLVNKIDSMHVASFIFTRSGDYRIVPSISQIGGLSATVYRDCDVSDVTELAVSWLHPRRCIAVLYSPLTFPAPTFGLEYAAVRYAGFIRSNSKGRHFIGVTGSGFVSIWVKEQLIALSQKLSTNAIEAPFQSELSNDIFDILIAHWQDELSPLNIQLILTEPSGVKTVLSALSLFSREDVPAAKTIATGSMSYTVTSISGGVLELTNDHNLSSEDPVVFSGAVPAGLSAGIIYYVKDTVPLASSTLTVSRHADQAMVLLNNAANTSFTMTRVAGQNVRVIPAQCCAARGQVVAASLPEIQFCGIVYRTEVLMSDVYGNRCFQRDLTGQLYVSSLVSNRFNQILPVYYEGSSAVVPYGPLTESGIYTLMMQFTGPLTTLSGFPASFQVFGGSFCSTKSTVEGIGLSSISLYASSAISIVNRDMFGNVAIGEFEGLYADECLPDVFVTSSSLVGGVATGVTVSSTVCSCCTFVTPFQGRGPMLRGSGLELLPGFTNNRVTFLNLVNGGLGVGGTGYAHFPPIHFLGKPAVFIKVLYTRNLPVFETSATPLQQSDDAADLTEFVSALPIFDAQRGRYVLMYTVNNLPSTGKTAVVSAYAGYHGALLATYYSIKFIEGSSIQLYNFDLDGNLASPCLVVPATSTFQGIQAPNGATSWVRPDELSCEEGVNATLIYGVRYAAWINSTLSDGVTLSFSPIPIGLYVRAIADTRNVKFLETELNTWDFQAGPLQELSARIVPQFPYFHVIIEMRFPASIWQQVPFPRFYNTSCSDVKGMNCGVYAPFSLAPDHNLITITKTMYNDDETIFPHAIISTSANTRGALVTLTVSFNVGASAFRGIKRIRVAGLQFASFTPSGVATCNNARNPISVGGLANAPVQGSPSSLTVVFQHETFVLSPDNPLNCNIPGFTNPSVYTNSSNSVVISTHDLADATIQYKPFVTFPEIP